MPSYAQYALLIAGKTFPSNYFYQAGESTVGVIGHSGPSDYYGSASGFGATNISGTVMFGDNSLGTFTLSGETYQMLGSSADGNDLFFTKYLAVPDRLPGPVFVLANAGSAPVGTVEYSSSNGYNAPSPTCFAEGTLIRTSTGDVPVELLREGDQIVLEGGELMPLKWLGRRFVKCEGNPWARHLQPVQISAGAFGLNRPERDLRVSLGHGLSLVDEGLVQAEAMMNGTTVKQIDVASVTYYHVELAAHAVIYAEGLEVESFVDVGNRSEFDNGGSPVKMSDEGIRAALSGYCKPMIEDQASIDRIRSMFDLREVAAL
jgi:hypothetical protein